jgi:hypothetical protein
MFVYRLTEPVDEFDGLTALPDWLASANVLVLTPKNVAGRSSFNIRAATQPLVIHDR